MDVTLRPRILDLFCCAGGAAMGYHRAGFAVYGVDIEAQPHYPFPFHQGDAIVVLANLLRGRRVQFRRPDGSIEELGLADFAAIHMSPPCQAYSALRHTNDKDHPELVPTSRWLVRKTGLPYIIENVPGAPLRDPVILCGTMFHLRAADEDGTPLHLRRHRQFESNVWLVPPGRCHHQRGVRVAGVYGGGSTYREKGSFRGGYVPHAHIARVLLGIDWMNRDELAQSIPPAYTEWLGHQLMEEVRRRDYALAV